MERLLEVAPLRRFMVQLPPAVESWREQLRLKGGLFRTIRWVGSPGAGTCGVCWCLTVSAGQAAVHGCRMLWLA